jgi:CRISPR-associated protein Csb1
MELTDLNRMVREDAALRRRQRLQPAGGQGDKVFPPTYPGENRGEPPRHVYERRRSGEREVWCVLVDSVQSQANRLEECLKEATEGGLAIPHLVVDFEGCGVAGIGKITSFDAPHRLYDAIFRDSSLGDVPFMQSDVGKRVAMAKPADATALLEAAPTALLFGAWHSTGEGGGLGAKFARCLTSEVVAVDVPVDEVASTRSGAVEPVTSGRRTGSRIDPLGILRSVEIFKGEGGWSTSEVGAGKKAKKVRPSEINHGNIAPTLTALGITCDHLEHTFVLSFAALRRLRFGSEERNTAGRALLAALGLLALAEQDARGYALRSRCDLVREGPGPLEVVDPDGSTDEIHLDSATARRLYEAALAAARHEGFDLRSEPIRLTPQEKLVEIVRRSQELALSGEGGGEQDGDGE